MSLRNRKKSSFKYVFSIWTMAILFASNIHCYAAGARTLNVSTPSEEDIRSRAEEINLTKQISYAKQPVTSGNYDPGALSEETQQEAIDLLNLLRYIAGIPDDVTVDTEYICYAQAGALVNYVNNILSHTPDRPSDMDETLFEQGYTGTSSGNISWSSSSSFSLNSTILSGWMADSGDNNLGTVGHRRWCLNPSMGKTGFGAVTGSNGSYACMYAFDKSRSTSAYETVVWPAQTMPTEYFGIGHPWSISSISGFSEDTSVKLTRDRDGEKTVWNFSKASSDGHFQISNAGYGMYGCVIFRPSGVGAYRDGDVFTVEVSEGGNKTLSYTVNFFSFVEIPDNAKIGLLYNTQGVKVDGSVYNFITLTDESVTTDKIEVYVEDDSIVKASLSGTYLWIQGLKEGKTKVTVSLSNGSSSTCNVTVTSQEHVHDYSYAPSLIVREATCYMTGVELRNVCECGVSEFNYYYPIAKTAHDYQAHPEIPATCTKTGLSAGMICSVCGYADQEQTVIPALGHEKAIAEAVEPTCTESGLTEGTYCTRCNTVITHQKTIAALGHEVEESLEEPATCNKEGKTAGSHCFRCGEILKGEIPIEKLPHTEEVAERIEPTCTTAGKTEGLRCSVCDEVIVAQEEIPALGHDWEVVGKGKEATCTESGLTDSKVCTRCDYVLEQEMIEALGHSIVIDKEVSATYDTEGLTEGSHCSVCGIVIVPQKTIPKLTQPEPVSPAEGTLVEDKNSNGKYVVTTEGATGKATVEYKAPIDKNKTSIKVPDTVTINNITYKVTSIAPNAFKNNKKLKKVTIGNQVTKIGANAFYGCKKLISVSIGKNVTTIGAKAFYGCKKLKMITIKTTKLTTKNVGSKAFKGIYSKATIKVPKKSLSAYKKLLKKKGVGTKVKIEKI